MSVPNSLTTSASPSFYRYSPLSSSTAIRLLEILPGRGYDNISCSIKTTNLEDAPSFEALSYVWGDSKDTRPIHCFDHDNIYQSNESTLQVTLNCWYALFRLRQRKQTKRIWIDAICINQTDNDEKTQQVGLMGKLYRKAACVLIYLGYEERIDTTNAFRVFSDLARKAASFPTGIQPSAFTNYGPLDCVAFCTFFDKPWFKRCWTLQEIGLARRAILICDDDDELDWDVFFSAIVWIDKNQLFDKLHLSLPTQEICTSVRLYRDFKNHQSYGFTSPPDFLDILMSIRNRKATNPKDRIYAFLDHPTAADEKGPFVVPSYAQFDWIVFYKFTLTYLKRTRNLRILSAVNHGKTLSPGPLPLSWIPWWNPSQTLCSFGISSLYDASAGTNESQSIRLAGKKIEEVDVDRILENTLLAEWGDILMLHSSPDHTAASELNMVMRQCVRFSQLRPVTKEEDARNSLFAFSRPHEARLSVRGLILDKVELVWPALDREDFANHSLSNEKDPNKHVVEILCNVIKGDGSPSRYEDSLLALSLTLTAGVCDSKPATQDINRHRASFSRYRNAIQTAQISITKAYPDPLCFAFDHKNESLNATWLGEEREAKSISQEEFHRVSDWQQYMIDASKACHNRRFFTTVSGFFGLGPEAMCTEDIFCAILFSARAPFILQKDGDAYRLVGEAYVHGVMNGEAIDMWKRGELKDVEFHIY